MQDFQACELDAITRLQGLGGLERMPYSSPTPGTWTSRPPGLKEKCLS